jgi:glycosyltransferase involved in cell wall biosynthesis
MENAVSSVIREAERLGSVAGPRASPAVAVSIVVPVTERCDDLAEIYRSHAAVLRQAGLAFEFIFVIDGWFESAAGGPESLAATGEPIRVLKLPRHFGEATALTVGFAQARGEVVLTLPAYFQTAPDGIRTVLSRLEEGYDLVVGRRWPRTDSWINRVQNYGFHFLTRRLTGMRFHDVSCGLKAIRKPVTREVHLYGDLHRFLPLLARQRGFRVAEVDVRQHPADRRARLRRPGLYLRRLLDILTLVFLLKFTRKPLRFFGLIGAGLFGAGFVLALVLAAERLLGATALADRPLLILAVLLMVLGVQTGSIGLLGEIIIFTHTRRMHDYPIKEMLR